MDERNLMVRKAYSKATTRLRNEFPERFHALLEEEYQSAGLTVRKRLTGERKRQAEIAAAKALLADAGEVVISD